MILADDHPIIVLRNKLRQRQEGLYEALSKYPGYSQYFCACAITNPSLKQQLLRIKWIDEHAFQEWLEANADIVAEIRSTVLELSSISSTACTAAEYSESQARKAEALSKVKLSTASLYLV